MDIRLKHLLKLNPIISMLGYQYREQKAKRRIRRYSQLPTEPLKILFATTEGRFNDSCRMIAEYLHKTDSDVKLIWAFRESKYKNEIPEYIDCVRFESDDYYRELATSSVWVFNFLIPQGTIKRKNQLYIQVWHGDKPFKKIANEAAEGSKLYRNRTRGRRFSENELCDYFMTGSRSFVSIWKKSVGYNGKIIDTGLPRNDIFLQDFVERAREVKRDLGIDESSMVLLYAPTFRDHNINNGDIGTDIDLIRIIEMLERKYNKWFVCLKRAHGGKAISLSNTRESERILDVTEYSDMTDLMLISDVLITDYSSCAGDFAYLNKPVLLYQDDFDQYTTLDRGLVFDITKTPFFRATNMTELEELIMSLTNDKVQNNCKEILDLYESSQTDHSTQDIVNIIINHMKK